MPNRAPAYMRYRLDAAGNGALMRTEPVALAAPGDRDQVYRLATEIAATPEPPGWPSQHFADALEAAVRLGGDTDTVAAVAGGLLGARWGLEAIPDRWTRLLHGERLRGDPVSGTELAELAFRAFRAGIAR